MHCLNTGRLACGLRYYVYHVLLYADDFQARSLLFPKGGVGGVYMLPIGLSQRKRRTQLSVRTISLVPNGVSTNHVLDHVINDIVKGSTQGFDAVDLNGERCKLFVDVIGFIGDYPASSSIVDAMSHAASSPCTHCSFRVLEGPGKEFKSIYGYSTTIHSATTSFSRGRMKTLSLRRAGIDDADCTLLGMNTGNVEDIDVPGRWPLLRLSDQICSVLPSNVALSERGSPVLQPCFDAYTRNFVAPDHLITGLITNLMEACLHQLEGTGIAKRFELTLRLALHEVGVEGNRALFNTKKCHVHSITMSTKFGLLPVLPFCIRMMGLDGVFHCFELIEVLHSLISLLYWWPAMATDGPDATRLVHGSSQVVYHGRIHRLVVKFVEGVRDACDSKPWLKMHLDKPNVHRLLELSVHTVPLYGHALLVAEMIFEAHHQQFKSDMSSSSNQNAHVYASRLELVRDWLARITEVFSIVQKSEGTRREMAMRSLLWLFGDVDDHDIHWSSAELRSVRTGVEQFLLEALSGSVHDELKLWYGSTGCSDEGGEWIGVVCERKGVNDGNEVHGGAAFTVRFLKELTVFIGSKRSCLSFSKCLFTGLRKVISYRGISITPLQSGTQWR